MLTPGIEAAEALDRRLGDTPDIALDRNVGDDEAGLAAGVLDPARHLVERFGTAACEKDPRALPRGHQCGGKANARRCAGDDDHLLVSGF